MIYKSTVPVLRFITPYLSQGSVLLFDDWRCFRNLPDRGQQRACREWLQANPQIELHEFVSFGFHGKAFTVGFAKPLITRPKAETMNLICPVCACTDFEPTSQTFNFPNTLSRWQAAIGVVFDKSIWKEYTNSDTANVTLYHCPRWRSRCLNHGDRYSRILYGYYRKTWITFQINGNSLKRCWI